MGRYATWGKCLDCQAQVGGAAVCPQCGLAQGTAEANLLRWHLTEADRALVVARTPAPPAPHPSDARTSVIPSTVTWPPMRAAGAVSTRTAPSTSTVLLTLGAACILVASIVFVSVAWSSLSIGAKAAILLGVTAALGAMAGWSLRRGLRGSAETFSCLFVVLAGIDVVAAHAGGLLGDRLTADGASWISGVVVVVAGAAWARAAVLSKARQLTGPQVFASLGLLWLALMAFSEGWGRTEWVAFALAAAAVVVAAAAARLAVWTISVAACVFGGLMLATALVSSVARIADESTLRALWADGDAVGLAACVALAGIAAATRPLGLRARRGGAVVASVGLALLVLRPIEGAPRDQMLAALAGTAVVCAVVAMLAEPVWRLGARVALVPVAVGISGLSAPAVLVAVGRVVLPAANPWQRDFGRRTHIDRVLLDIDSRPLAVGLTLLAAALAVWVAVRLRAPSAWTAVLLATPCAGVAILGHPWPLWGTVVVVSMLALAAGVVALAARLAAASWVAAGYTVLALVAASGSEVTTAVAAGGVCVVLAALSWWSDDDSAVLAAAAASVGFGGLSVAGALAARDLTWSVTPYALIGLAAACVLAAQLSVADQPLEARAGIEFGSGAVAAVAIALAAPDLAVHLPVCLTVAGATLVAVGLLRADRWLARGAGTVLLIGASWSRLLSQHVGVVEAYTLPTALLLCGLGLWRVRTVPKASTVASLTPGLTLLFLPSLSVAVTEPTSLRALLLGLGALAVLLAGAALRWAAPLVVSAATLLVLAVVNVAPYANAVPRWVLFGLAGAALLYLGVTWERRLRNARTLIMTVELMR